MIVNSGNFRTLGTGFNAAFQRGLGQLAGARDIVATTVPSSNAREEYGWMGKVPGMREWLGDRVLNSIKTYDYAIKNRDWESTIEVERNDIEDDNLGLYGPLFEEMGRAAVRHPDQLIWQLLKDGFANNCYDGQFFFDTDHPVLDANGETTSATANTDGGAGTAWFLMDTKRAIKPIIFQERKKPNFVSKDRVDDDNVFMRKKFVYGVDARYNVGYGFWQFVWGSKQPLTPANYAIARAALMGMKGDYATPLGIMPDKLVVPPSLESDGRKIVNSEYGAAGITNEWKGTAELEVVPWLA